LTGNDVVLTVWKKFSQVCLDLFPAVCFLYVKELQRRRMPFWHAVQLLLLFRLKARRGDFRGFDAADHPLAKNGTVYEVSGMNSTSKKPLSVLIADDDGYCRETLRDIVEPEGYRTVLASSGEEAIEIVQEGCVHIALFDVQMPRLTGVETVQLVHQINAFLPCILITANATQEVLRQAFQVRAYSVIPKPVSKHMLLFTMFQALKAYEELLNEDQDLS
jgi:CheY-like chemotaxis protein